MSSTRRRKTLSVVEQLAQAPHHFAFLQAVALLQRHALRQGKGVNPIGGFVPPESEAVRFVTNQSLSFPGAEIESVSATTNVAGRERWDVAVNFMGLSGSLGVLPYHYTELILQRLKMKDESLLTFFDLFNHRTISLFHEASTKYRLAHAYEKSAVGDEAGKDSHTQALLALIGLGTANLGERLFTRDEALLHYSGLLSQQIRTSSGLRQMLQHHFNVPITIREHIGQWQELIDDVRTRLPNGKRAPGQNNRLGKSAMLGRKGWLVQGKFRVIIGPLNGTQLQEFAPGNKVLKAMDEIVRFYSGIEYDYEFIIQIKRSELPFQVKLDSRNPPVMGWNSWLPQKKNRQKGSDEIVEISVYSGRLN